MSLFNQEKRLLISANGSRSAKSSKRLNAIASQNSSYVDDDDVIDSSTEDDDEYAGIGAGEDICVDYIERGYHKCKTDSKTVYKLYCWCFPSNRRRLHIHRSVCRATRLLLYILLVPIIFLLLYFPLYSGVQTRQVALPDWGYNTSRNVADYVLPNNDTTILEPRNICRDKVFLLIIVFSSLQNFATRQTIRETWGNTTEFNYNAFAQLHAHLQGQYLMPSQARLKYYSEFLHLNASVDNTTITTPAYVPTRIAFLIGRNKYGSYLDNETIARIHNESEQYDDIIEENFIDSYNNLTLKSVLAMKWLTRRCLADIAFYMKCDDDTFVNIPNLLHFLLGGTVPIYNSTLHLYDVHTFQTLAHTNRLNRTSDYLTGHLFCTARPVANVSSKWYMPYYMYPGDKYPTYLSGAGYVMSADIIPHLYRTALNTSFVHMEDVYLTGICAERMHLKRHHHPLFAYTRSKKWCSFKGSITQHEIKDESMLDAYQFVTNMTHHCPPPPKYLKIPLRKSNNCV